jgi:beta-fructofuranosidase
MALRLADKWVWDFWLTRDGADYHVFYLQAPRSLVDQQLRHLSATIGHAVSKDLKNWRILRTPCTLARGEPGTRMQSGLGACSAAAGSGICSTQG